MFVNNFSSNSGINAVYTNEHNSFSTQPTSSNKRIIGNSTSSVQHINNTSVNVEKNKLTKKNSTPKLEKPSTSKHTSIHNKTELNKKKI